MLKYACGNKLRIEGINETKQNIIKNYLYKDTDLGRLIEFIITEIYFDELFYGWRPWNYEKEIYLCLIKQGFLKNKHNQQNCKEVKR